MSHKGTIFYILENNDIGTWWVGKMTVTLDDCGWPPYRSTTQDDLCDKLSDKYGHYLNPYLALSPLNKGWKACYGVERWLSKLEYNINKEPEKYGELKELLTAGWNGDCGVSTLSVIHVFKREQPVDELFKKLVKSREGLTKCLNFCTGKTRVEKYKEHKKEDVFNYKCARGELLRYMKKTGKIPKQSTLDKYGITSV